MEGVKKLIENSAIPTDVTATDRTDAQADVDRLKELVNDLCFEDQRMSSSGQEIYGQLREFVGL